MDHIQKSIGFRSGEEVGHSSVDIKSGTLRITNQMSLFPCGREQNGLPLTRKPYILQVQGMCETSQERGKSEVFLAKGVGSTSDMFPASCPQFQHATALVHQSKREHFRKSSLSMFIH